MDDGRQGQRVSLIVAAAASVVAWKLTALVLLARASADGGVPAVKVLLAGVGLVFVGCGLFVFWRTAAHAAPLFAAFALCAGLHWGGPLELPPGQLRSAMLFVYLLVSSLLGEALFLHFALRFPRQTRLASRLWLTRLLYLPTLLGVLLAVVYLAASPDGGLRSTAEGLFLLLHVASSNLFPAGALVLFIVYRLRSDVGRAERRYVGLMIAGMLTAWLPYLIASAVGAETDPWNLFMAALPISFAIGIRGVERARRVDLG